LLAALLSLVLATGVSSSVSATPSDNRVDANSCTGFSQYDRPIGIRGTFTVDMEKDWPPVLEERRFNGCFGLNADGYVLTAEGPVWIIGGSLPFARGYKHGKGARSGVASQYPMIFVGDGQHDNYFRVDSYGRIWNEGRWKHIGLWSDWYNSGYRNGYLAEAREQEAQRERQALEACRNSVRLVNVEPKTYGPELTFQIAHPATGGLPYRNVVVGYRAVTDDIREPRIVEGSFPDCVNVRVIDEAGPAWSLGIYIGLRWYRLGYTEDHGPTVIHSVWNQFLTRLEITNEDLWDKTFRELLNKQLAR